MKTISGNKVFRWLDTSRSGDIYHGPFNKEDIDLIGKKQYHSLEELLKLNSLSETIKIRLCGARVGTTIIIRYLHNAGHLALQRVSEDEFNKYLKTEELKSKLKDINSKIYKSIPDNLKKEKATLEKELRNMQKDFFDKNSVVI